ncbi:hypothetical protein FACS189449_06940 [Alphaproteobacteria bacterium]|nr:hypothetical protein FACS189449_06940 [Alphaproteobacteria bacterium]
MKRKLFDRKVKIEIAERKLSKDNAWFSEYVHWNELWASISLKDISARRVLYFFTVKWRRNFPNNFRVLVDDKVFLPTQPPVVDPSNDCVVFHAVTAE